MTRRGVNILLSQRMSYYQAYSLSIPYILSFCRILGLEVQCDGCGKQDKDIRKCTCCKRFCSICYERHETGLFNMIGKTTTE
jgi:hypothetical protein